MTREIKSDYLKNISKVINSLGLRISSYDLERPWGGFFVIDEAGGTINFSNQLVEKVITLRYISDSLGTDEEIKIHKFAEDAIYKYITHAIGSAKANMPEYIINRFRKEKRAAMRNAKLRLANLKTEEMTQVMRGKAKMIK